MPQSKTFKTTVGSEEITFETGKLAGQAGGAVTVRAGDTLLLCTATMAREPRTGIDFFPLSVDYEERLYAAGKIPGSYFRREGRPTDGAILVCRLTDRPLRPLFPEDLRNDVQVIITSLSSDLEHQIDILGIIGASAAMTISDIPFGGPVGAVRVGYIDEQFVVNPTASQMAESTLDLRLAGTADAILMVECGANELPEHLMVEALRFGHEQMQPIIAIQNQMREALGKPKSDYQSFAVAEEVVTAVRGKLNGRIAAILNSTFDKDARNDALDELEEEVVAELTEEASGETVQAPGVPLDPAQIKQVFHDELKAASARAHPQRRCAPRWPRADANPPAVRRDGAFASRARLRAVHARRDAGAHDCHARHAARPARDRRPGFRRLQALHAPLQLSALLDRRSARAARQEPPRDGPRRAGRTRAHAGHPAGEQSSRTPSAW